MKKILASILVLTMLVCCMSISAFAVEDPAVLTIDDVTVTAGETVQIPVNISVKKDLAAVLCTLTIDERLEGAAITRMVGTQWSLDNLGTAFPGATGGMTGIVDYYSAYNVDFPDGIVAIYHIQIPADAVNGEYTLDLFCDDFAYVENEGGEASRENTTTYEGATYSDKATLTVVGGVDPQPPVHEHEPSSDWASDENTHWNTCECGDKVNEAAHEYADDADASCDVCGYERVIEDDGDDNTGDDNTGDDNTGDDNTGDDNTGDDNTGDDNTGDDNTGDDNTGDDNTGDDTTGDDADDGDKEEDKEEDKKDDTTETGDNTNLYIYMAICLFAAAAIVVSSYELKKNRG